MLEQPESRRAAIFTGIALGLASLIALITYMMGGVLDSPVVMMLGEQPITLGVILLAFVYPLVPTIAHIITRVVTKEGWENLWLRPNIQRGWPYWVAAFFVPPLLAVIGMIIYFVLLPTYFDSNLSGLTGDLLRQYLQLGRDPADVTQGLVYRYLLLASLLALPATLIGKGLGAFTEEFGWRGYLLPRLRGLGMRKALLLSSFLWGLWRVPVVLLGQFYGGRYPGAPYLGVFAVLWVSMAAGVVLGWLWYRSRSIWPSVIAGAIFTALNPVALQLTIRDPNPAFGPMVTGIFGSMGWLIVAVLILGLPILYDTGSLEVET